MEMQALGVTTSTKPKTTSSKSTSSANDLGLFGASWGTQK
jgi:hypothetical protein